MVSRCIFERPRVPGCAGGRRPEAEHRLPTACAFSFEAAPPFGFAVSVFSRAMATSRSRSPRCGRCVARAFQPSPCVREVEAASRFLPVYSAPLAPGKPVSLLRPDEH